MVIDSKQIYKTGKYEHIGIIGEGKYGKVIKTRIGNEIYAVKYFKNITKEEIANEIKATKIASMLRKKDICPHFPNLYYFDDKKIVMEHIDNSKSLFKLIKTDKSLNLSEIQAITFQVFASIYALNVLAKVLHTDLHLNNILVQKVKPGVIYYKIDGLYYKVPNYGYKVYVIDFGLAYKKRQFVLDWLHRDRLQLHVGSTEKAIDYARFGQMLQMSNIPKKFKEMALPKFQDHANDNDSVGHLIKSMFSHASSSPFKVAKVPSNVKVYDLTAK